MKKSILFILVILGLNLNVNSEETNQLEKKECKHTSLHYAVSIQDIDYVKDLLETTNLKPSAYDKYCNTTFHLATELGSLKLLNLLEDYDNNLNIENGNGENLMQYAIKVNQPEVLLFLINKGYNPEKASSNNSTVFDYHLKYGNLMTKNILEQYKQAKELNQKVNNTSKYEEELQSLKNSLAQRTKELENIKKTPANEKIILAMENEIKSLKEQINTLEGIIITLEEEIKYLRNQLKDSDLNIEDNNFQKDGNVEVQGVNKSDNFNDTIEKNGLPDITVEGEVMNDSLKLFDILSKPIYKVKDNNDR
tara:strand:- start:32391 stop:33314 length:924 start_codon:yes stop_codon:yes gene_type:complete